MRSTSRKASLTATSNASRQASRNHRHPHRSILSLRGFFEVTTLYLPNDPIPWCAAFINFCIRRNGGTGSSSASSQSFLSPAFGAVESPQEGDLAVFTCFSPTTGENIGLGHVAIFRCFEDEKHLVVVGGNQATRGHSSIISEKLLPVGDQPVKRRLSTGNVLATSTRLNKFVRPGCFRLF